MNTTLIRIALLDSVVTVLLLLAPAAKAGGGLPDPYATWLLQAGSQPITTAQSSYQGTTPGSPNISSPLGGYASVTFTLGADPSLSGYSYADGSGHYLTPEGYSDAKLTYGFEVINRGGGTATSVPIIFSAEGVIGGSVSGNGALNANIQAGWGSLEPSGQTFNGGITTIGSLYVNSFNPPPTTPLNSSGSGTALVSTVGDPVQYGILLQEEDEASGAGIVSASTLIDCQVAIDPAFAQAADYEIVFASGVGPVATAPDMSSTFGLFGLTLAGLFGVHRRLNCH